MVTRWNRTVLSLAAGMLLVGCSLVSAQQRPDPEVRLPRATPSAPLVLRPGVSPVMIEAVRKDRATISWKSRWVGRTRVIYGDSPKLMAHTASRSPVTFGNRLDLGQLEPGTRYYVQVETETAAGVARSAICSFRTP